jgi:hypothetical protein
VVTANVLSGGPDHPDLISSTSIEADPSMEMYGHEDGVRLAGRKR